MKTLVPFLVALLAGAPFASGTVPAADAHPFEALFVQPGETVLVPELRALVLLPEPPSGPFAEAASGLDTARVPWIDAAAFAADVAPFLGRAVSFESLERLVGVVRLHLRIAGRPFALVYAPPQDITEGIVHLVVRPASLDGAIGVDGGRWFSSRRTAAAMRQGAGDEFDLAALREDLAWLNRNPFREVTPVIEAGAEPGTTRAVLRAEERFPLSLTVGYDNTGTRSTDEDRVSAAVRWGNAFGRGDLLDYRFAADPRLDHVRSHSVGYTAFLPWRHVLSVQGSFSTFDARVPVPFEQEGESWQVSTRLEVPLPATRGGVSRTLGFTADVKHSDNTLEFAAIPVTGNVTRTVQFGVDAALGFDGFGGRNDVRLALVGSPGGLGDDNDDAAFDRTRPGARAAYGYARLGVRHRRALSAGWTLLLSADAQLATGPLLGGEQLAGAGASAVRGYRESSAFGDGGLLGSAELHAPSFVPRRGRLAPFAFVDAAALRQRGGDPSSDLASAGVGAHYVLGRLTLRAAWAHPLRTLPSSPDSRSPHAHLAASVTW